MKHLTEAWTRVAMPMMPPDDLAFRFIEGQFMGRGPTVVALSDGEIIGFLVMGLEGTTLYDQEWAIDVVYVVDWWRRKGIATLLMREAFKHKPELRHSNWRSPDGEAWARAQGTTVERQKTLPARKAEEVGEKVYADLVSEMGSLLVAASRTAAEQPGRKLMSVVMGFANAANRSTLGDPAYSEGMCISLEHAFRQYVATQTTWPYRSAYLVGVKGMSQDRIDYYAYNGDRPNRLTHNASCVQVDGTWWTVDFTYSQFDPEAPWPLVEREDAYLQRFDSVRYFNESGATWNT